MSLRSLKKKTKTAHQYTKGSSARHPFAAGTSSCIDEMLIHANELFLAQQYVRCQQVLASILDRQANNYPALQLLGHVHLQTERFLEALHTFEQGQPHEGKDLHCSFGRIFVLIAIGRIEKAFIALEQLPVKDERVCEVYFKLGRRLFDNNRLEQSLEAFQQALRIAPSLAGTHYNIGMIYETWAIHQQAATAYELALAENPNMIDAHVRLAKMYLKLYRTKEALAHVDEAIKREGEKSDTCNIAAQVHMQQLDHKQAIELFQRAIVLQDDNRAAHFNLIYLCNFLEESKSQELMRPSLQWVASQCFAQDHTGNEWARRTEHSRLRVGYLSPDFREHSVSYFFIPLIEAHSHEVVEVFCYSGVQQPDAITNRIKQAAEHWHPVGQLTDEELVQRIREDEIDILVELSGYTFGSRLLKVFSEQPAPIQVSWMGYPNTTGMPTIHYRLTDWIADPAGEEEKYSETLYRLPGSFLCYDPLDTPIPASAHDCHLDRAAFVFGSFNNIEKMTRPLVVVWAGILRRVPDSTLLLKSRYLADPAAHQRLQDWFSEEGIVPQRLDLRTAMPTRQEHFELYGKVDLALDPYPYNGTTTTFEALWAGVPVLTLRGDCHRSRVGTSILTHLGLDDYIAATPDDYIEKAVYMAGAGKRGCELCHRIRQRLQQSVMMDKASFARQMEEAFQEMWRRSLINSSATQKKARNDSGLGPTAINKIVSPQESA